MPLTDDAREATERAAQTVAQAQYVTALVGAGMSAESGVPTFRGPKGLWTKYGEPDNLGFQRFTSDPRGWWEERLNGTQMPEMRDALAKARPNPGHHALAKLEQMGVLRHIVTQNVDNLHRVAGSVNVCEIHGNTTLLRCVDCNARFNRDDVSLEELPPQCPHCSGYIKMDTVMFGEPIPQDVLQTSQAEAVKSDCVLILGTSGIVYPAAALPELARQTNSATLIEINPDETALSDACDIVVRAATGEALPILTEILEGIRGS